MKNDLISARIHVRLYCSTVSTEHDMSGMLYDDCIIKILGGKKIGEVSQPAYWLAFPFYWVSHHYKSNSNSHGLMMLLNYLGATSEYCQCFMSWVLCKKVRGMFYFWGEAGPGTRQGFPEVLRLYLVIQPCACRVTPCSVPLLPHLCRQWHPF